MTRDHNELKPMSGAELRAAIEANRPRKPLVIADEDGTVIRQITTTDNIRQSSVARCSRCGYFGNDRQFGMLPHQPSKLVCEQCAGNSGAQILERADIELCGECGQEKHS